MGILANYLTLLAVLAVFALFELLGRALPDRRGLAAYSALPAGWGIASLALTLIGVFTPLRLVYPAIGLGLAVTALLLGRPALLLAGHRDQLKSLAVSAGFLLVAGLVGVSAVDSFTYWLPNARFLYDRDLFPASGLPTLSLFPTFPHNLQLISYLAGLVLPFFPATAMIAANALLLVWFGGVLARSLAGEGRIGWAMAAFGLLLATLLNPSFVPDLALSSYGEVSTGILTAIAARLAADLLDRPTLEPAPDGLALGLCLAALVNIKESNGALVGLLLIALFGWAILSPGRRVLLAPRLLAETLLPPLIAYAAWRYHVGHHLADAPRHSLPPPADWHWAEIGAVLSRMGYVAMRKGGHFGLALLLALRLAWLMLRERRPAPPALLVLAVWMALGFSAFLLLMYVSVFAGPEGLKAQSFWRFSTQLGPLLLLAAVGQAAPFWQRLARPLPRPAAALLLLACLAAPLLAQPFLRIDRKPGQQAAWAMGKEMVRLAPPAARLDLVMPGDDGNLLGLMKGALTQTDPRRTDLDLHFHEGWDDLSETGLVWLSCLDSPDRLAGLEAPPGSAVLAERRKSGWGILALWPAGLCHLSK